jgi:hypothetical protein
LLCRRDGRRKEVAVGGDEDDLKKLRLPRGTNAAMLTSF